MAENAQTTETTVVDTTDYKALYEQTLARAETAEAEATKQKNLKDNYAKEAADNKKIVQDYKNKEIANMSEDEKKQKEWQEMLDGKAQLEAEVAQLKLEKEFVANGFSAEETEKLIKGKFAVKDIADIIKARCDEAVKSAKAEGIKNSTPDSLLGNGTTGNKPEQKSDYKKYQDSKQKKSTIVEFN